MPNATSYKSLPIKSYNLTMLNAYGKCLGLTKTESVMDWAGIYRKHLKAEEKCDWRGLRWKTCGEFFIRKGANGGTGGHNIVREDVVMLIPTPRRPAINQMVSSFADRHFAAGNVAVGGQYDSVRQFFDHIISCDERCVKKKRYHYSTIPFGSIKRPVGVVCVCTKRSSNLALSILSWGGVQYSEPACSCHAMDADPPVRCPQVLQGLTVEGDIQEITNTSRNYVSDTGNVTYFGTYYGEHLVREAPFLHPYISQTGHVRCHRCNNGGSVIGRSYSKKRFVSCAVDVNRYIVPILAIDSSETDLAKILRLAMRGQAGLLDIARKMATAQDPVGTGRGFEETIEHGWKGHPKTLRKEEFWLLIFLPTMLVLGHVLYRLLVIMRCVQFKATLRTRRGHILLALGDLALEIVTSAYLWATVKRQQKWAYARCMELPVLSELPASGKLLMSGALDTMEMLVTYCTEIKLKADVIAAAIASSGAAFAFLLLCLEVAPWIKLRMRNSKPKD